MSRSLLVAGGTGLTLLIVGTALMPFVMIGLLGILFGLIGLALCAAVLLGVRDSDVDLLSLLGGGVLAIVGLLLIPVAAFPAEDGIMQWAIHAGRPGSDPPAPIAWSTSCYLALAAAACLTGGLYLRCNLSWRLSLTVAGGTVGIVATIIGLFAFLALVAPRWPLTA